MKVAAVPVYGPVPLHAEIPHGQTVLKARRETGDGPAAEPEPLRTIDADPIAKHMDQRLTHIPLRFCDLKRKLARTLKLQGDRHHQFQQLCKRLQSIFHAEHLSAILRLEEIYGPLDPDDDAIDLDELSDEEREQRAARLMDELTGLLYSAHYKRLTRDEIDAAVAMSSQWGVRMEVDFDIYRRLEIFARGYRVVRASRRRWQNFFRLEEIEQPEFQRLIMAFQIKPDSGSDPSIDAEKVYLKTFKDIPETDLEILLPGSKIKLSMIDRGKIILPTVSGMAITIFKLLRGAIVLAVAFTLHAIFLWIVFIGAIVGYLMKSVFSYFQTKNKYQFGLTQSLYLKNLDNNSSVIFRILNEAEDQELLETILCYCLLWNHRPESHPNEVAEPVADRGMSEPEIDQMVEEYLLEETGIDVNFEIHDALGKLARLNLADVDAEGMWRAVPVDDAVETLDQKWSRLFRIRPAATNR